MRKSRLVAATTAAVVAGLGIHAGQELAVAHGMETGKAFVVSAPAGRCALTGVYVDGAFVSFEVAVTSRTDALPSAINVVTAGGEQRIEMYETGKGSTGLAMVGGRIATSAILSEYPINPYAPGGAVYVDTPEGPAACGVFVIAPYAGGPQPPAAPIS